MYLIAFFGTLLVFLSTVMVVNPEYWSKGIVKFSEAAYFHLFEIVSRLLFGAIFITFADQTLYPTMMSIIGYMLVGVGVVLSLTPPSKHRLFAAWSAQRFSSIFRPAGVFSFIFGIFIIYAALWETLQQ
ncbi:MAG: hypothetical protein L3J22_04750 [Xanthomonadales bacterium]|nr:hypothetical protein [Xanthomonadales bacterium]